MAMVITDNSPSAGYIAWTGMVITLKGVDYNITNGNSNKIYLWWDLTNPNTLQESDTLPTLTDDDSIILVNRAGTHYLIPKSTIQINECIEDRIITDTKLGALTGWIDANETWLFASAADDPNFTITIVGDKTAKYGVGMRIKLTQTTVKYFIIMRVEYSSPNTTLTLYGGNIYEVANAAISLNYYSPWYAPLGFPLDATTWDLITAISATQNSPVNGTWYNGGSAIVPIGAWTIIVNSRANFYTGGASGAGARTGDIYVTLSSANNTESDSTSTKKLGGQVYGDNGMTWNFEGEVTILKSKVLTAKASWYVNMKSVSSVQGISIIAGSDIILRCNYV